MISISLFLSIALLCFTVVHAKTTRTLSGGYKVWPWSDVTFGTTTTVKENNGDIKITCSGAGILSCPTAIVVSGGTGNPFPDSYYNDMLDYAKAQITAGTYSGSYNANFIYNGVSYIRSTTWSGSDEANNETIVIIVPL